MDDTCIGEFSLETFTVEIPNPETQSHRDMAGMLMCIRQSLPCKVPVVFKGFAQGTKVCNGATYFIKDGTRKARRRRVTWGIWDDIYR